LLSVKLSLRGNTGRQQFENDKQNVDVAPPEKFLRTPMEGTSALLLAEIPDRSFRES